jgi:hypothetical protein
MEKDNALNEIRILVIDINFIPSEIKDRSIDDIQDYYEEMYNEKVFLIDNSRQNLQGFNTSNNYPIYFIK